MLEDNKKDVNKVEVTHEIKGQEYTVNLHREGNKFIKDEK
ncbi:Uncharacterised protein [Staphylococcus aureus]|nr:Uncharacterised protein [Staphylococcus aureus]